MRATASLFVRFSLSHFLPPRQFKTRGGENCVSVRVTLRIFGIWGRVTGFHEHPSLSLRTSSFFSRNTNLLSVCENRQNESIVRTYDPMVFHDRFCVNLLGITRAFGIRHPTWELGGMLQYHAILHADRV